MTAETKSSIRSAALLAVAVASLSPALGARAATHCVDPGGAPCFTTIQAAVNAAAANDLINVHAATYTEQVTINKNLTIVGAGAATTIIQPVWPMVADANGRRAVVSIFNGAVVNLSAVTVRGRLDQAVFCDNIHYGVYAWQGANVILDASIVTDIVTNQGSLCNNGDAIRIGRQALGTPADRPGHATVTNTTVQNFQKGGIVVDGAGSTATLTGNTITGLGVILDRAMNGIQIGRGATAQVTGNSVDNVQCGHPACGPAPTQDQSMGIYLYRAAGSTVSGNTVSNTDVGLYSNTPGATATLTDNTLTNTRYYGIIAEEGTTNATHNIVTGTFNIGIAAYSYQDVDPTNLVPYHDIAGNTTGTFRRNTVLGGLVAGFDVANLAGSAFLSLPTGSHNRLVGNPVGIRNQTASNLTFNDNWFGCNAGPGNAGCDTITGPVTATSWLILRASANPMIVPPVLGATSIVSGDVRFNNGLVDTSATSFIRDQTPMSFAVTGPLNNPIAPPVSGTVNGVATSTYTVAAFPGTDNVCVTLDNETVCFVITVSADLSLIKTDFLDPIAPGRQEGYTITVTSNYPVVGAKMVDTLPTLGRFQRVRVPLGWSCATPYPGNVGGTVVCTYAGTLPVGTYLFGIDILAPPACNRSIILSNTATVTSLVPELVMTNNTDTELTTVINSPCFP